MTKKKVTRVAIVVDKSGSMYCVRQAALDGVNEQIQTLRSNASVGGDTFVSVYFFSNQTERVLDQVEAASLTDISYDSYIPNGGTALRDAVWTAMNDMSSIQDGADVETAYLVIVISDGEENMSTLVDQKTLAERIQAYQATNRWTFTYMLSNSDLSKVTAMGIPAQNVTSYTSTYAGTSQAFTRSATATATYLNARSMGATMTMDFYIPVSGSKVTP